MAITSSSFSFYILVERLSQTPFTPGLRFPKYQKFYREILIQLNFVYNRTSGEFIFALCLFKNIQTIRGFSGSLAISKSSLFCLHLGRETFQKPFYTWVFFSKISSQNVKHYKLLNKAKQSQDRKRLKLVNVLITKKKHRAEGP